MPPSMPSACSSFLSLEEKRGKATMNKNVNPQTTDYSTNAISSAAGPLAVSKANPRYFTVASQPDRKAIYLTGSHIWNNFHDGMGPGAECSETPETSDFEAYLAFLKEHNHNFIRLWRWEQFQSQAAGGGYHLCMTPQPWQRKGPGEAKDGKPKFNLELFNESYF